MFALVQFHKWDADWIDNTMPWELDVFCEQLKQHLEEERAKQLQQQQSYK
jgi:hypothetical protein